MLLIPTMFDPTGPWWWVDMLGKPKPPTRWERFKEGAVTAAIILTLLLILGFAGYGVYALFF